MENIICVSEHVMRRKTPPITLKPSLLYNIFGQANKGRRAGGRRRSGAALEAFPAQKWHSISFNRSEYQLLLHNIISPSPHF